MKIITDNQIIVDGKGRTDIDDYYNAGGKKKKKGALGGLGGKIKDFVSSGKAGAVLTALSNPASTGGSGSYDTTPPPPPAATKKPMTTTTKVLIGAGAVAVVGVILYLVLKGKKAKAGK